MRGVYRLGFPLTPTPDQVRGRLLSRQGRGRKSPRPVTMFNPFATPVPSPRRGGGPQCDCRGGGAVPFPPPAVGEGQGEGGHGLANIFLMQFDTEML